MRNALAGEGLKSAPPVSITAFAWMNGLTLNEIVAIATLLYIGLQMGYLVWKWIREWRAK